jgi:hypothetical protein
MTKIYLSDGAYADLDERGLVLTAENGIEATDTVVLDGVAWSRLVRFVEERHAQATQRVRGDGQGQAAGDRQQGGQGGAREGDRARVEPDGGPQGRRSRWRRQPGRPGEAP